MRCSFCKKIHTLKKDIKPFQLEVVLEKFRTQFDPEFDTQSPDVWKQMTIDITQTIIISVLLFLGINLITARIRIESVSMEDTLHPGNAVLVNRLAYRLGEPARGDIVVFEPPFDSPEPYIKRIVGLPGDEVTIQDSRVYVNGIEIQEPYIKASPQTQGTWQVPWDTVFVMGDNRNNSSDSRSWGSVPLSNIIGKAVFVYWPPEDVGSLTNFAFAARHP
jgi:signal peptidase I